MYKIINYLMICLLLFTVAGCGGTNAEDAQKEKEAAADVIRQFEATQASITYKDPSTFTKGDAYLTPDFAKKYHEMRAGMEQFIKDSKATVSGTEPKITFIKQEDDNLRFDLESDRTITSEQTGSSAVSQIKYIVTVAKQDDGSYLISHMEEPK